MRLRALPIVLFCVLYLFPLSLCAKITQQSYLDIKILYDNSGSMYPGYRLPGQGGVGKSQSGVGFFHQYPEFRDRLKALIKKQARLNGRKVSIAAFTEEKIETILSSTHYEKISHETIVHAFENLKINGKFKWGLHTELRNNLENYVKGFEGVVWLVTDNIIDTKAGSPDYLDIKIFFKTLRDRKHYKSVHLYKYPFQDVEKNQNSNLAMYGMLVSPHPVAPNVIAYFDRKFRDLKAIFPGREHRQLKDPKINPLELKAPIEVDILDRKDGFFKTSQRVRLKIDGVISSNLTHHSIVSGNYHIAVQGPFKADPEAVKEYGVTPGIRSNSFHKIRGSIGRIEPLGSYTIKEELSSNQYFTLSTKNLSGFIKSAFGIKVHYSGKVRMDVYNLKVNFEREELAGIYGIDKASEIFDFQDFNEIKNIKPSVTPKEFVLTGGGISALILLVGILLFLLLAVFGGWLMFAQHERCEIRIDSKKKTIALRRLSSHNIKYENQNIGKLSRNIGNEFKFSPNTNNSNLSINSKQNVPETYHVRLKETSFTLEIKPLSGGKVTCEEPTTQGVGNDSNTVPEPPKPSRRKPSRRKPSSRPKSVHQGKVSADTETKESDREPSPPVRPGRNTPPKPPSSGSR